MSDSPRDGPWALAQFNIATLRHSRGSPELVSYQSAMDALFPVAIKWPGFVWIMEDDEIIARTAAWYGANVAANLSVWADLQCLRAFMNCRQHLAVMDRGADWFVPQDQPTYVFWWTRRSHQPTFDEARGRLDALRRVGPTEQAFTLDRHFRPPLAAS
jgi:hypothetical protein